MQRPRWPIAFVLLACLSLESWPIAQASDYSVASSQTLTLSLANNSYDSIAVTPPSGHYISIEVNLSSGGPVDFWILDQDAMDAYNTYQRSFPYRDNGFGSSFFGIVSNGLLRYLVVDNQNYTDFGAVPTGPVNYTAVFEMHPIPPRSEPISISRDFVIIIVISGGLIFALARWQQNWRRKQGTQPASNEPMLQTPGRPRSPNRPHEDRSRDEVPPRQGPSSTPKLAQDPNVEDDESIGRR